MPIVNTKIGENTRIVNEDLVNIYGASIGKDCMIGPFVEIQEGVEIGNNCRIQSHTFIPTGVKIRDNVFIGHGVMFINDTQPKVTSNWKLQSTLVKKNASIGSNATILPVKIGYDSMVGAGSVVTRNVRDYAIVCRNPAQTIKFKANR